MTDAAYKVDPHETLWVTDAEMIRRMGGKARAATMSKKRRKEIARRAAQKRWKDKGRE